VKLFICGLLTKHNVLLKSFGLLHDFSSGLPEKKANRQGFMMGTSISRNIPQIIHPMISPFFRFPFFPDRLEEFG
jgi:hypothetical protein